MEILTSLSGVMTPCSPVVGWWRGMNFVGSGAPVALKASGPAQLSPALSSPPSPTLLPSSCLQPQAFPPALGRAEGLAGEEFRCCC